MEKPFGFTSKTMYWPSTALNGLVRFKPKQGTDILNSALSPRDLSRTVVVISCSFSPVEVYKTFSLKYSETGMFSSISIREGNSMNQKIPSGIPFSVTDQPLG
eukprot:TRINITY_DN3368_c0_g1_i6.p1 TRINITY_DN3368_c0_g1~~TRINITY_DN3368_c0_g1_i6.p1  ORF type:complete len:103 (-),score=6.96 TRINITY_DN3368_c0_g1_i6:329-637(-)